mmetsp:Transcript_6796/g.10224  ORF Transcript_6796/g.10224 Transcript_6796/m.10224 type:complete len:415 (-) Transcript_6796:134-1378(-)|eukprot:CAMPEP_0185036256 /NCGR_PEP_ID=MMETSP1103-20130426/28950_1 /TAXON_ID=36769 /ORGANISM="Paraphysomonas bandaiensis, Strain Caron Lab Isolate" /LENGTH=414 /DNA_ID=CAMNT_0027573735 /DNA_START=56 /DNA_END=1300 /DNA_ORIENTATION=-
MSIQGDSTNRPQKSFESVHDRESLHNVRDKYSDLNEMIESLNEKLNVVASVQEKEFLSAYRVHMLSVQLELKELKLKVAKAEMSLQDDGEVSKLEEECNWFRTETMRLQTHSSTMQTDIQAMKSRLAALRDQNKYLSNQLKAVMKRSRVLEVEIEMAKQSGIPRALQSEVFEEEGSYPTQSFDDDVDDSEDAGEGNKHMVQSQSAIALGKSTGHFLPLRRVNSARERPVDSLMPPRSRSPVSRTPASRMGASKSLRVSSRKSGSAGTTDPETGRGQTADIVSLRNQYSSINESRTFIETLLEDKVREAFANVIKRRSLTVARNSKNRYFKSVAKSMSDSGHDDISVELDSTAFSTKVPTNKLGHPIVGGITDLGLEHLTDGDKHDVMISVLSDERVFKEVVERLHRAYVEGEGW